LGSLLERRPVPVERWSNVEWIIPSPPLPQQGKATQNRRVFLLFTILYYLVGNNAKRLGKPGQLFKDAHVRGYPVCVFFMGGRWRCSNNSHPLLFGELRLILSPTNSSISFSVWVIASTRSSSIETSFSVSAYIPFLCRLARAAERGRSVLS
jgi:hypothetical protein